MFTIPPIHSFNEVCIGHMLCTKLCIGNAYNSNQDMLSLSEETKKQDCTGSWSQRVLKCGYIGRSAKIDFT